MNIQEAIKSGGKIKRQQSNIVWHVVDNYLEATGINEGDCLIVTDLLADDWTCVSKEVTSKDICEASRRVNLVHFKDHGYNIDSLEMIVRQLTKELGLE